MVTAKNDVLTMYVMNGGDALDLSKREITLLLENTRARIKEISNIHISEPKEQRRTCRCNGLLKALASMRDKLEYEQNRFVDYSNQHVLIVDDVSGIREYISILLKENGFCHIDEADDGHEAIVKIKTKESRYGKQNPYDLVLCDLDMPTISGLDVLKLTRENHDCSGMPFIMVTGLMAKESLLEAINLGVSGYLSKPFKEIDLLERIDEALQ